MNELTVAIGLIISLLTIATHILNMSDRAKKEGARAERVNSLFEKIDRLIDRVQYLEKEIGRLKDQMSIISEENEYLRKSIRELSK